MGGALAALLESTQHAAFHHEVAGLKE